MFGRSDYLEQQNAQLLATLTKALKVSQALNIKLADGLDRVLISKFDPPLKGTTQEQPQNGSLFPDLGDVLSTDDDGDFVERMESLTK